MNAPPIAAAWSENDRDQSVVADPCGRAVRRTLGAGLLPLTCWMMVALFGAAPALASPLDLKDPTPRWIEVRFEESPANEPGSLDRHWSASRLAKVTASPEVEGALEIRIPAAVVEAQLRSTGTDAIEGSFSEFVWTLDSNSGHVIAAALRGEVREVIRLGPFRSSTEIAIEVEMTTVRPAGFMPDDGILGIPTNRFCEPQAAVSAPPKAPGPVARRRWAPEQRCVAVDPVRFDRRRGYVNAVGSVVAASPMAKIRAFSPLGEVQFREIVMQDTTVSSVPTQHGRENAIQPAPPQESLISGPKAVEALCSAPCGRTFPANLGGES